MKVVIDCNIFVMAIPPKPQYHRIIVGLRNGDFILHLSTEIYLEIEEKILEKFRKDVAEAFVAALNISPYVINSEPFYKWNIIVEDEDDNKYLDCYIKSNADYLITNDKHFNVLKQIGFPRIDCLTIDEFMELLNK